MADGDNPQTPPNENPGETGGDQPAATPPEGQPEAATKENESVTLSKEDYKNLVSQRDRANNQASENDAFVEQIAKERGIDAFLEENKKDFPDLTRDDLMHVGYPGEDNEILIEEAKRVQSRLADHVQAKLLDVQQTSAPVLSPEERAQRLKQLKKNPSANSFDEMVNIQQASQ